MGGFKSFLVLSAIPIALASPVQQNANSISLAGLGSINWPNGRPLPVKTTRTRSGARVGWVRRDAQINGPIASSPPPLNVRLPEDMPTPEVRLPGAERGPEGTVPFQLLSTSSVESITKKQPPPGPHGSPSVQSRAVNDHYYGNSYQVATNYGGSCWLSVFNTTVSGSNAMSLIQINVSNNKRIQQTVESGWQVYPGLNNGSNVPHLFTFYTVNGYKTLGDNLGGYNTNQKGWVQVDSAYYPGMTFSPLSTVGGAQYEIPLSVQLYQGNWWINVANHWMGYYPGSMYAVNGTTKDTMAEYANLIYYYGEEADGYFYPPKNDMGSGQFAKAGFGKAAYMHNLTLYNTPTTYVNYNGVTSFSNGSWYTIDPHFNTNESWGSYFFVGGPGGG